MSHASAIGSKVLDAGVLARLTPPLAMATERELPLSKEAMEALPIPSIKMGSTVVVAGRIGSGTYSLLSMLLAEPSRAGLRIAILGLSDYSLSSAASCGVNLNLIVVTDPRSIFDRTALARAAFALADGCEMLVVDHSVAAVSPSRLSSRARQRRSTLLVLDRVSPAASTLPIVSAVKADLRLLVERSEWSVGDSLGSGIVSRSKIRVLLADRYVPGVAPNHIAS